MKACAAAVLSLFLAGPGAGQEKESKASLKDTIAWMTNFTETHGYMMLNNAFVQSTKLSGVEGCTVQLERSFPAAKTSKQIKTESANIVLGDFDPEKVKLHPATLKRAIHSR